MKVSVKTRLGLGSPEEFGPLLEIFEKYPLHLLIIHPRVRKDFYSEPVRIEAFSRALEMYSGPVCYNGGLVTAEGCCHFQERFPQVDRVMIGQGLLADPALAAKAKGEPPPDRKVLRAFHDGLYQTYLEAFGSPAQYGVPHEGAVELPVSSVRGRGQTVQGHQKGPGQQGL